MSNAASEIIPKAGNRERIELGLSDFKGKTYLSIRTYYRDLETQEFKPSPKGLAIPADIVEAVRDAVNKLADQLAQSTQSNATPVKSKTKTRTPLAEIDDEDRPDPAPRRKRDRSSALSSTSTSVAQTKVKTKKKKRTL